MTGEPTQQPSTSPKPWLTRLRVTVLALALAGVKLHVHALETYEMMPFPREFLPPPLLWSCAPYIVALVLSCTRHQALAAAFAASALMLDAVAYYQVYIRPHVHRRFELRGLPLYAMPAFTLLVVGPLSAVVARFMKRGAAKQRTAKSRAQEND